MMYSVLRCVLITMISLLVFGSSAWAADLSQYVDKSWDSDKVGGKTFLEVGDVKKSVVAAVGSGFWDKLREVRDHPLKRVVDPKLGTLIVLNECNVGGCGNAALLMLKMNAEFVGACFFDDGTRTASWFGPNWKKQTKSEPDAASDCYGEDVVNRFKRLSPGQ